MEIQQPNRPLPAILALACVVLTPPMLVFARAAADGLMSAAALMFLLHSWRTRDSRWLRDPVMLAGLVLWLWLMLAVSPLAIDPMASFSRALTWPRYLLFYAACYHWLLREEKALKWAALSGFFMLLLVALDALVQHFLGHSFVTGLAPESGRLTGPMGKPVVGIFTAKLLFPVLGILALMAARAQARLQLAALSGLVVVFFCVILLSGERTAFLTALLGFGVAGAALMLRLPQARMAGAVLMLLIAVGAYGLYATQDFVRERAQFFVEQVGDFTQSVYGQVFLAAYEMGMRHPVTGVGLKGFRDACPLLQAEGVVYYCNIHAHNPYLEFFSEAGIPGLIGFITLVGALCAKPLMLFRQPPSPGDIVVATALAALTVHFFPLIGSQSTFSNWSGMLLWYSVSLAMASLHLARKEKS